MPLTADEITTWLAGTDPRVVINCRCQDLTIAGVTPFNSTSVAAGTGLLTVRVSSQDANDLIQINGMLDAIADGDADVWYLDGSLWTAYDDLPLYHSVMHMLHQFHPPDQAGGLALAHMINSGDYSTDDSRHQYNFGGHFHTRREAPLTSIFNFAIREWQAVPRIDAASRFEFQLQIPDQLKVTADDLDNFVPMLGIELFLDGTLDDGETDIGTDFSASDSWTDRDMTLTFADSTTMAFEVFGILVDTNSDDHVVAFEISCDVTDGGGYDINKINGVLATANQSISGADVLLDSPLGEHDNPVRGREFDYGGDRAVKQTEEAGNIVTHFTDDGEDYDVGVIQGNTRIIDFDDLPTNADSESLLPLPSQRPLTSIIRVSDKIDPETIYLPRFQNIAKRVNNARPFQVHNHNDDITALIHLVESVTDNNIVSLRPGEHGDFVASFNSDGTGRLIGHVPTRVSEHFFEDNEDAIATVPYVEVDSDTWGRIIPLDSTTDAQARVDSDAYTLGSATFSNGIEINAALSNNVAGCFTIEKPGTANFVMEVTLVPTADASGAWTSGHGIRLYRLRGLVVNARHRVRFEEYAPASQGARNYRFEWEDDDIRADDRFLFVFSYDKMSSTLTQYEVMFTEHTRRIKLDQHIDLADIPA